MSVYRRILVPVDGSATSRRGLREAMRLAKDQKAKLALLHVVDEFFVFAAPEAAMYSDRLLEDLKRAGRKLLEKAQASVRAGGLSADGVLSESVGGRAADEIVKQAKKLRADLIVLGTHGRRGVRRLAMGSDAELVVRNAPVPVLVVRGT